jgi:hypothetical protein
MEVDDITGDTTSFKIIETPIKGANAPLANVSGVPEENLANATRREQALIHDNALLAVRSRRLNDLNDL